MVGRVGMPTADRRERHLPIEIRQRAFQIGERGQRGRLTAQRIYRQRNELLGTGDTGGLDRLAYRRPSELHAEENSGFPSTSAELGRQRLALRAALCLERRTADLPVFLQETRSTPGR